MGDMEEEVMSGITKKELEFIEFVEKSYLKQRRNALTAGTALGIAIGMLLTLIIVLIA
jgi:hypothetical protein